MVLSVAYPLSIPTYGINKMSFDPDYYTTYSQTRGGRYTSLQLGPTLWKATFETYPLIGSKYDEWRAWVASLRGGGSFYLYDIRRMYPVAYPNGFGSLTVGGSPWTGTCNINTVHSTDNHSLILENLPIGFVLSTGDYFAFTYDSGTKRALHRVVIGGVVNGVGRVTVNVEPEIRPGWTITDVIEFANPSCVMTPTQPFRENVSVGQSTVTKAEQIIKMSCMQTISIG